MTRHFIFATLFGISPAIAACGLEVDGDPAELDPTEVVDPIELDDPTEDDWDLISSIEYAAQATEMENTDKDKDDKDKDDKGVELRFKDLGIKLKARGKLEKLDDKKDVHIKLKAKAKAVIECKNPGGGIPPGQQSVVDNFKVSGKKLFPKKEIDKGKLKFRVTTEAPDTKLDPEKYCPNKKWTATLKDLKFTKAKLIVDQKDKKPLIVKCTFDKPTHDGKVPEKDASCKIVKK